MWKQIGLAGMLAVGGVGFWPSPVSAQDDPVSAATLESSVVNTNDAMAEDSQVVEATGGMPIEVDAKGERRNAFRDSFNKQGPGQRRNAVVTFGKGAELKTNETAEAVVAIGGSATAHGKVRDAVVAIGGDVTIDGAEVGDAVVAVLGNIKVLPGSIVHGEVVAVGGKVEVAEGAKVEGEIQEVDFGAFGLPKLNWLKQWVVQCVFKLRPLALAPGLAWVWMVAGAYFLFYLLLAVAFPRPVEICLAEITRRPATTFLMGLLTKILLPLIFLILAATGVGVVVIPFFGAALFFGALVGKVAFLEYLGQSLGRAFGTTPGDKAGGGIPHRQSDSYAAVPCAHSRFDHLRPHGSVGTGSGDHGGLRQFSSRNARASDLAAASDDARFNRANTCRQQRRFRCERAADPRARIRRAASGRQR